MNWKANFVVLAVLAAALSGIRGLASLAEADTSSPIACYAALVSDITPLIEADDSTQPDDSCPAVPYRTELTKLQSRTGGAKSPDSRAVR